MTIDDFVVDTQKQITDTPNVSPNNKITSSNKSSNKSLENKPKTTVEQQIQEYKRSQQLSTKLFNKYNNDGWDSLWSTPTLTKDNNGVKSIYIPNLTFLKLVEYFTQPGQQVCDVFMPSERSEVLSDLTVDTTFVSNEDNAIQSLSQTYKRLQHSPYHNVQQITLSKYNELSGMYQLITVSLPTFKDAHIKLGEKFTGTPQQYIVLLNDIVTTLSTHLNKQGSMVLLVKDFHDGKYIPILPLIPHVIKLTDCTWTYTAVVRSGAALPESLWIKFYQEKRFKLAHAYLIGLTKNIKTEEKL